MHGVTHMTHGRNPAARALAGRYARRDAAAPEGSGTRDSEQERNYYLGDRLISRIQRIMQVTTRAVDPSPSTLTGMLHRDVTQPHRLAGGARGQWRCLD